MADDRYLSPRDRSESNRRSRSADQDYYYTDRRREPRRDTTYYEQVDEYRYSKPSRQYQQELVVYRRDSPAELDRRPPRPRVDDDQLVPYDSHGEHSHHRRHKSSRASSTEPCKDKPQQRERFLTRHFDSSYDGIIAALAGAALGGMTVDGFTTPKKADPHRRAKILGGAIAGAVMFNAGENAWRGYIGEEEEKIEKKVEKKADKEEDKVRDRER